jgi:hypothetical protein
VAAPVDLVEVGEAGVQAFFKESSEPTSGTRIIRMQSFLITQLFPLIKPFSTQLDEDHPQNYYMEREWRVSGPIEFSLGEVTRVVLPTAYARTFREDFPNYYGQVSFADRSSRSE